MKKRTRNAGKPGFTLVEVMIAATISLVVIGGATVALINSVRTWRAEGIRSDLHMDLEIALERISHDLRLSSVGIGLMAFHPPDATEYTAISFPLATPDEDTGLLPRDENNNIIWDTTVIYHVRPGSPDELIRTTFQPRNPDATPEDLQNQLETTVMATSLADVQNAALAGETGSSRVVFRNLVNMVFRPPNMSFDGYAPQYERARTLNWGSIVLSNGVNRLSFTVQGRNRNSTGFDVGIDRLALSYSGSPREGEMVLPVDSHPVSPYYVHEVNRGSVIAEDMSIHGASWSGNCQLTFQPPAGDEVGSRITLEIANDLWCDTNFDTPSGVLSENCSRKYDRSFTNLPPYIPNMVVSMDAGISWDPENLTDGQQAALYVDSVTNTIVVHGGTEPPSAISLNGAWVRFQFHSGVDHGLDVRNVTVARRAVDNIPVAGTVHPLLFNGSPHTRLSADSQAWTDWIRYEIDRDESYLVKWERRDTGNAVPPGQTHARAWINNQGQTMSYLDGDPDHRVIAVGAMEVRVPSNAVYRSGVFDTRIDSPTYREVVWTPYYPNNSDGEILLRVRGSDRRDMRDAFGNEVAWHPASGFQNHTGNNISAINGGRYVQYEAQFSAWGEHRRPPRLRDVSITWDAPTGIVDLNVDFARGPNYGIITADVNGQSFVKGIEVDLEIFREGPFDMEIVSGTMEVRPLNTGR